MKKLQFNIPPRKVVAPQIHSPLHELIDTMRTDFGETAIKGTGSFGYYLGLLKNVPLFAVEMWYKEVRSSSNLNTGLSRCKVFFWKYKQWKKKLTESH